MHIGFEQGKVVGRFLKGIREKKGETQQEVAKLVNMSTHSVWSWENCLCTIVPKKFAKIVKAYRLDFNEINEFMRLTGYGYVAYQILEESVLEQLRRLPKESRDRVIKQIESDS